MAIDLLLINPNGREVIYQNLGAELAAVEQPLWCRLIAGYCSDRGHTVWILDADAENISAQDVARMVRDFNPRLVCIVAHGHQPSASTQSMVGARKVAWAVKESTPRQRIVITGGHVAALPHRTLAEEPVDYICRGEGPVTVERLLAGDPDGSIPGLGWRESSLDWFTPAPEKIADLDRDLHGRAWDMLPMENYRAHNWQCFDGSPRQPYAAIYTSLGCPYSCSFCMINAPFGGPGYRRRSPQAVVDEVAMLYDEYNVRTLKITDEMFVLNPKHYIPICEGLAALPFADELNIWAYARVDTVASNNLALLRRAGIRWLALGIESASSTVRDGASKTFKDSHISGVVKAIQAADINVIGNFIIGLPGDTVESVAETVALSKSLDLDFANFYSAMAYPGSKLFTEADPRDLPAAWSGYSQHSYDTTPLPTATLTSAQVLALRDSAFHEFFSDAGYLENVERKFGTSAATEVGTMLSVKLKREIVA